MKGRPIEHIIKACLRHDLHAQKELYLRYVDRLYYVVLRYVNDPFYIENILQDIFLKVFKNLHQFDSEKGRFEAWIKTIAIREAINHCKKKFIRFQPIESLYGLTDDKGFKQILEKLEAEEILDVISKIPDKYRLIFNMYEIDGYSHKEICQVLKINESTSRSYLTRAKQLIRAQLNYLNSFELLCDGKEKN